MQASVGGPASQEAMHTKSPFERRAQPEAGPEPRGKGSAWRHPPAPGGDRDPPPPPPGACGRAAGSAGLRPASSPPNCPLQKVKALPPARAAPGARGCGGRGLRAVVAPAGERRCRGVRVRLCEIPVGTGSAAREGQQGGSAFPHIPAEPRGHPCCPADLPHGRSGPGPSEPPGRGQGDSAEPPPLRPHSPALIPGAAPGWEARERELGGGDAGQVLFGAKAQGPVTHPSEEGAADGAAAELPPVRGGLRGRSSSGRGSRGERRGPGCSWARSRCPSPALPPSPPPEEDARESQPRARARAAAERGGGDRERRGGAQRRGSSWEARALSLAALCPSALPSFSPSAFIFSFSTPSPSSSPHPSTRDPSSLIHPSIHPSRRSSAPPFPRPRSPRFPAVPSPRSPPQGSPIGTFYKENEETFQYENLQIFMKIGEGGRGLLELINFSPPAGKQSFLLVLLIDNIK
ncbi:collagen alpha-1(I) chain-like [Cinclus cinclus]|uniref:collagen alpha-1(I) chain-like n=1 Tax=Cinclus cinclus TaxID=127875 RepID=UPI002E11ADF5